MSPRRKPGRRLFKAFLPILLLLVLGLVGLTGWLVYGATHPPRHEYLVTPDKFELLSHRGLKATSETWTNLDGTTARGWLLRGDVGAPAVVMLHRYGTDRSWLLNLGVKISETTNFTVLWPDQRGHGEDPPVGWSSFGAREAEDVRSALEYLRGLKTDQGATLVADRVGLYGVEMGAHAALVAAARDAQVRVLVLDSVPATSDDVLRASIRTNTGLDNGLTNLLSRAGLRLYFLGSYQNTSSCAAAKALNDRAVLLLSGTDAPHLRDSTTELANCFPKQSRVELHNDLPLSGFTIGTATGEQGETYDRRVIEFFAQTLRVAP
jgi:pimeloyl-ACP methyl ester carboxylesterase